MSKNISGGALGGGAFKRIGNTLHMRRLGIGGEKIHINPAQEKEIINRTTKAFGKDGKSPYQISERDFEKELNDLAIRHVHGFDSKKAAEVEKALGLTEHTNQIGNKYRMALRREKEAEKQERLNPAENIEAGKFKKSENRFSRLDKILSSIKGDKSAKDENNLERTVNDKFAKNDAGQKTSAPRHRGMPAREAPIYSAPPSDIDD